jgi:hypothetical protein
MFEIIDIIFQFFEWSLILYSLYELQKKIKLSQAVNATVIQRSKKI